MLPRLLIAVSIAILSITSTGVAAGLEQLESRYGQAYPGYAGLGGLSASPYGLGQQSSFGMGVGVRQPILQQQPIMQQMMAQQQQPWMQQQEFEQVQPQLDVGFSQNYGIGVQQPNLGLTQQQPWQMQQQFGGDNIMGMGMQEDDLGLGLGQQQMFGAATSKVMPAYGANLGVPSLGAAGLNLNLQQLGLGQQQFGGVGSFGAGSGLGASKKTTTAQPIFAQSMIVPKVITQPILRPHAITQPIIQQQLIQQPIVETRQVIQPVIRKIITQPIIRPEIYESTTIQPTLKTETTVQPHIVQQTVVSPVLQNQYEENKPITEKARMQVQPTVVQPTISAKKSSGGLGAFGYGR